MGETVEEVTLSPPETRFAKSTRRDRDATEATIVSLLAGVVAERFAKPTSGYIAEAPDERHAEHLAERLATLSPRSRELLQAVATTDAPADVLGDVTLALSLSEDLVGTEASAHVSWLSAVAHRLVREQWPAIVTLAQALEQRGHLSGAEVRRVIETAGNTGQVGDQHG